MRIPEIAKRLRELSSERCMPELDRLADELGRRRSKSGPVTSQKITDELREQILQYAHSHPWQSQMYIATTFGVNSGRVSEILYGKRK